MSEILPPGAQGTPGDWICARCNQPLTAGQINVSYLGNAYPVNLLRCPTCGLTLVTEELALGKMADVEKALEDK